MRYKWIENIEDFKKIREEWDDSLIKSDSPNPFLLSDFIISWWKWFGTGCMLRILIVFDNDVITGGLPLYLKKGRFFKILKHIGDFAANYTEPFYLKKKNSFFYTLKDAFSARNDWDVLCLTDVREGNKMISEYTVSALRQKFTVKILKDHYNWAVDLSEGFEVYMKTLSKRLKRYLKSNTNCIEEKYGNMELKKIKGKDNIERYFDTYNRFSIDSFSRRNRNSNFTDPDYSDFFREFLVLMDNKDRLDAHVLTAGDNTLAVSFSYRFGKGLNWALTSFNYEYKHLKPGYLLIYELIKDMIKRGETYYNWYGYERFYKREWCNASFPLLRLVVIRKNIRGLLYSFIQSLKNKLKTYNFIVSFVRKIKKQ